MKLRDLKNGPLHAWPPMFGGSYGRGDTFPVGEVGVLRAVENARTGRGLRLEIEYAGRTWAGIMQWDGDEPSRDSVREVLGRHVGTDLRTLRDVEVG
jgi:hypothetical protein